MTHHLLLLIVFAICTLSSGCSDEVSLPPLVSSELLNPTGNVTLWVYNASHALTRVDMQVSIDGELLVSDFVTLGGSATPSVYGLALPPGRHRIDVVSAIGDAYLVQYFTVTEGMHWAELRFEYAPWYARRPCAPRFLWTILDRPIEFG